MIIALLIIIPFLLGAASFFIRNDTMRRMILVLCAAVHLILSVFAVVRGKAGFFYAWFAVDELSGVFLLITSALFFGAAVYAVRYLKEQSSLEKIIFSREAIFCGCLLMFLSTMTTVIMSRQLALLWVGVEATTLSSAPLIYFNRTKRSLEATWKYLLICSVGIAIALLGVFFLAVANNAQTQMLLPDLIAGAGKMNPAWLKAAFLLLFVGYGTKMGLAPFHTWLPDAHSEAPSVISALFSGALLNCAFLGILRAYQVCAAAGLGGYCRELFIVFGLLSILFAGVFILGQADYKRMLAYSSIEHMGIIILGVGLGGAAVFGALLNMLGHSLTKAGLFLVAGNILSSRHTKVISEVRGLISGKDAFSGALWFAGFLLISGTPPSGIFFGKFMILKEALSAGKYFTAGAFLLMLAVVFIGMARIFISMTQGEVNRNESETKYVAAAIRSWVPLVFFILVMVLGLYLPDWLSRCLSAAAAALGGINV